MEFGHDDSIRQGRFVRYVFLGAALLPWPFVALLTLAQERALAMGALAFDVFALCNYYQMRRITGTMERWVNRNQRRIHLTQGLLERL